MGAVVTYDVSSRHVDVKNGMKNRGYSDHWTANGATYYLPNTTLWKDSATVENALADIKAVCAALQVRLERAVAVPSFPWAAIPGQPHS